MVRPTARTLYPYFTSRSCSIQLCNYYTIIYTMLFQGHVTVMCVALLNRSLRAHSTQQLLYADWSDCVRESVHNGVYRRTYRSASAQTTSCNSKQRSKTVGKAIIHYLLTGCNYCKGHTLKYLARCFQVRTELARSVSKKRGLSISQYGTVGGK